MNKPPATKIIGVVLVDNIPPQISDSQLYHFLEEMDDVSAIQCIADNSGDILQRSCWIHVSRPKKTIEEINALTIAGKKPRARLMGYLFAA